MLYICIHYIIYRAVGSPFSGCRSRPAVASQQSWSGKSDRAGSVQFVGAMVQTMVVWVTPMPIKSPLKETVEAGVPAQVPPLQPVPET